MLYSPEVDTDIKCRKSSTLDEPVRPMRCSEAHAKDISDRKSQMIVQDLRPIQIVECNGFHDLIKYLEARYVLPSRKLFTADINLKYAMCKKCLKEKLGEEAVFLSLTTDIWTSIATESYITVTAHFIDNNLVLKDLKNNLLGLPAITAL